MTTIPKLIFIVPYRDREQQQKFFDRHMRTTVLENMSVDDYKIFYIHQCDSRSFNRGGMKNIGFLYVKDRYPDDYRNITLVFNDVDTMPFTANFLPYDTTQGVVKHFYGYDFALGGIFSIKGGDFERVNGFPNFFLWSMEDNAICQRVLNTAGLRIDRSNFYKIMDKNILQCKDGLERVVNRKEFDRYQQKTTEGIRSIRDLEYNVDESTGFINITRFNTGFEENKQFSKVHDLRQGSIPFKPKPKRGGSMGMMY